VRRAAKCPTPQFARIGLRLASSAAEGPNSRARREAALNWLAFGLLLAAWNAADDGEALKRRPESLRGYSQVSVRAIARAGELQR